MHRYFRDGGTMPFALGFSPTVGDHLTAERLQDRFPPAASISPMDNCNLSDLTQVVDGNWGIHAIIKKNIFAAEVA